MKIDQELSESVVSYRAKINASPDKVWEVISTPGNLNFCHPFCKENTVAKWGEIGAEDAIEYYNGLVLYRLFTKWNEGKGYELLIGRGIYATAKVLWTITAVNDGISELSITINVFPDIALKKYSKLLRGIIGKFYFLPNMSKYVKAVVKGFKYYIETGTPVKINQFGYNRMFSTNIKNSYA